MKTLTLSDHVASQQNKASEQRNSDYAAALQKHQALCEERRQRGAALRAHFSASLRQKRLFAVIGGAFRLFAYLFEGKPRLPVKAGASREEVVWMAGGEGEQRVSNVLARRLSDDWTLISGYRNAGGEIDQLLVSRAGVLAVEIKTLNGRIYCEGDRWWRDKYDKYGNCVERSVPIVDKGGRAPSAQVNASADRLETFLSKRGISLRVSRAVVLAHDSSEIGLMRGLTIDYVTTLKRIDSIDLFKSSRMVLAPPQVDEVISLIRQDHSYHERPRQERTRVGDRRKGRSGAGRSQGRRPVAEQG